MRGDRPSEPPPHHPPPVVAPHVAPHGWDDLPDEVPFEVQRAATRRRNRNIRIAVMAVALGAPILYLSLTGRMTPSALTRSAHRPIPKPPVESVPGALQPSASVPGMLGQGKTAPVLAVDPVLARDLHEFVWIGLRSATGDEQIALKAFQGVTGQNYKGDEVAFATVQSVVLPHYKAFYDRVAALHPATPEVRFLQHRVLLAARLKLMAFQQMLEGRTDPDAVWRVPAEAEMDESGRISRDYQQRLIVLAQKEQVRLPGPGDH